ncbi:MAG TPA: response regulator transcription factor [Hydrogenophaga sp.]
MFKSPTASTGLAAVSKGPTEPSGLLIIDDHELVRVGLRTLIQSQLNTAPVPVFEARTLADALEVYAAEQARIGLVFLDLGLADAQGLTALRTFKQAFASACVVVLSGDSHPGTVDQALALGAKAYLKKTGDLAEVIDYLRTQGLSAEHPHEPDAAILRRNDLARTRGLSERQVEILDWVLQGKSNREIGELAFLAEGTVKNHVSTILLHFGVKSRAQLISSLR